ncbi:MAG: recombinase family protein [Candidatus Riflebacteria bacterium]|nr:recombinase family protein [Candidatus Riflebacteria bacterium]
MRQLQTAPKAAGYIRVSTDEQAESRLSLQAQEEKIRTYVKLHDIELLTIETDSAISGKNIDRPALKKLLALIESGQINTVIVSKLDRLSRSVMDTLRLLESFKKAKVAFHSIQEKIDTKTATGRFFLTITAAFAEMERGLVSERTSAALRERRRQGKRAGEIPYGYNLQKDSQTLKLNPKEQEAIALMLRLRKKGRSLRYIAKLLVQRDYKTKKGGEWRAQTIKMILQAQEKYCAKPKTKNRKT